MILPTETLKTMVDEIVEINRNNTVLITLNLRNHQDPNFVIDDAVVDALIIEQDTVNNTTDKISMKINIKPKQLRQLIAKQSDLYADIVIEYSDRITNAVDLNEEPIVLKYKVFIHDLSNIAKRYGIQAIDHENEELNETDMGINVSLELQLISEIEHKTNRAQFVGMIRDVNPEEAIKYAASVMGISNIKMVTPDNQTKFQHLNIPPNKGDFRTLFDYMQEKYGVYTNGFRHYMSNGTLYIYPPLDMKSKSSPRLNILRVSENTYLGPENFFKIDENGDVTIVSNSQLVSQTLSNSVSENEGNTKMFVRSDGMIDGQVKKKGDKLSLNNVTATMSSKNDQGISKDAAIPKYVEPTMNLYNHASTFSEANTELLGMGWSRARINMLVPGMPVTFIFDEKDTVMSKDGILESITYIFSRVSRNFICSATFIIRVDTIQKEYEV